MLILHFPSKYQLQKDAEQFEFQLKIEKFKKKLNLNLNLDNIERWDSDRLHLTSFSFRNGQSKLCKLPLKPIYIIYIFARETICFVIPKKKQLKRKQMAFPEQAF